MGAAHPTSTSTRVRRLTALVRVATLDGGGPGRPRAVEITLALLLGVVVAVLPMVALWLAGRVWGLSGPGWAATKDTVQLVALIAGPP